MRYIFIAMFLLCNYSLYAQIETPSEEPQETSVQKRIVPLPVAEASFTVGERLEFSIEFEGVSAGMASLTVQSLKDYNGRKAYHFVSRAKSAPFYSWLYQVDDRIESYLDAEKLHSLKIIKKIREGKYKRDDTITFLQDEQKVEKITNKKPAEYFETWPNVLDILSAFYIARIIPLEVGKSFELPVYDIEKTYALKVDVLAKETIRTRLGKIEAFKVRPDLKSMGLFKHKGKIDLWVSADGKCIPLLLKSTILVGSIEAVLVKYEGK